MTSTAPAKMRLAVVGAGEVVRNNYAPFLAAQPDVELGFHNRTRAKAEALARDFNGRVFNGLSELVAWDPVTVFVLTSETCRYEYGTAVINSGAARVFFEKPLVAAAGQAQVVEDDFFRGRELLALAAKSGCETAMVFNYRFFAQVVAARRIAAERKFGRVISVAAQVHYACWSHCIDLMQCFAGPIAEVSALSGGTVRQGKVVEGVDVAAAFLAIDGAAGTIVGTAGMQWQHPLFELIFTFEHGRLHLRDLDGTLEVLDGAHSQHETISFGRDTSRWANYDESFRASVGAYLQTLRDGSPPPVPGIDGLRELQFEAALRRSISKRRPVRLADGFPLP